MPNPHAYAGDPINRLISWNGDLTNELMQPINYEQVNEIFKKRLECSKKFLNQFV